MAVPAALRFKEVMFPLNQANSPLGLYSDDVLLLLGNDIVNASADFEFQWLPHPRIELSFATNVLMGTFPSFQLASNLLLPTVGQVTGGHIGQLPRQYYADIFRDYKTWEEFSDDYACDRFEFQIPNFSPIFGIPCLSGQATSMCGHYIEYQDYIIEIHPRMDAKKLFDKAIDVSGYVCTHVGHISRNGGKLTLGEAARIATAIGDIISVLVGKNRYPVMLTGIDGNSPIVIVPFLGDVDNAEKQATIMYYDEESILSAVFGNYFSLMENADWQEEIKQLVFWYLQAANWSSAESTVVLTQVALEMASWIELTENGSLISQGGFETLPAADKIRLLADKMNFSVNYSPLLNRLEDFGKAFQAETAIDSYVQIRNALVHPKKKNRQKISKQGHQKAIRQAGHVGLHILELYLLYKFGFQGRLQNRLTRDAMIAPWK